MCLDTITKTAYDMPDACIAYKIVLRKNRQGELIGYLPYLMSDPFTYTTPDSAKYPSMGWGISDENHKAYAVFSNDEYLAGVHAYTDREFAVDYTEAINTNVHIDSYWPRQYYLAVCVKVLLRGPICEGMEYSDKVVVYKECIILNEEI